MRRPATITAPFGTPEESARLYKIPKRRAKKIIEMVKKSLAKKGYFSLYYDGSSANKNGAKSLAPRSPRLKAKARARTTGKAKSSVASRRKPRRAKAEASR